MSTPEGGDDAAENTTEKPTTDTPKITPVVPLHQAPDVSLAAIASIADFVGFPLTLYMPWGIATGHTTAPNQYYKHLADSARSGEIPPDIDERWADVVDDFAKRHFDPYTEMTYSERMEHTFVDGFDLTSHLNLKDVSCWIGGFPQAIRHDYLRVRLADVTAWSWGIRH